MSPKIVDKIEKKKQIGLSALSYLAQNGIYSTSMTQLAIAAGVGKGTIYEYFSSKQELIGYSMQLYVEGIEENVSVLLEGIKDPRDRLRQYTVNVMEHIVSDPKTGGILLAIFQLLISNQSDHETKDALKKMFNAARQTIDEMIQDGVSLGVFSERANRDKESIATNLIAFLDGIWLHSLTNDEINLHNQVNDYLDQLLISMKP